MALELLNPLNGGRNLFYVCNGSKKTHWKCKCDHMVKNDYKDSHLLCTTVVYGKYFNLEAYCKKFNSVRLKFGIKEFMNIYYYDTAFLMIPMTFSELLCGRKNKELKKCLQESKNKNVEMSRYLNNLLGKILEISTSPLPV